MTNELVPTFGTTTVRGITLAFTELGEGPTVFSLHGLSSSRASAARVGLTDYSPVAEAGFRLISYDARGHGESTGTGDPADYLWSNLADDLFAVADHLAPGETFSAIGLSMGTGTILTAASVDQSRFDRLVLTAPPTIWQTRAGQAAMYAQMVEVVENSSPDALAALFAASPVPEMFTDVAGFASTPDISDELLTTVFRGAGMTDLPSEDAIASITRPTLLLPWSTDPGHPVSSAEKLHTLIHGSELEIATTVDAVHGWGARAAAFLAAGRDAA